jgi:protein-glutamine gamma-glutamyltransferase
MLNAILSKAQHLPREARDTLFLLFVIAWVIAPQTPQLPLWCSALAAVVLVWRGLLAWRGLPLPSKWWLAGLLVLAIAATLFTHRTILGRDAGVTLIVVLLALKTLELRAKRDAFVVFFLGFFTMLTNFFFSQSLLTAAAMLVALLGLLTALVNAHLTVGKPPLAQAGKIAGKMVLLGAPIMAVLFVLFPRLAPLWGTPSDAMTGRKPCRWAVLPNWRLMKAWPCESSLKARRLRKKTCIFAAPCSRLLMGANGNHRAHGSRADSP